MASSGRKGVPRDARRDDVERAIEAFRRTFERMKPYLTDRWRFQ